MKARVLESDLVTTGKQWSVESAKIIGSGEALEIHKSWLQLHWVRKKNSRTHSKPGHQGLYKQIGVQVR